MTDDNSVDKSFENEVPAPSPMVQIPLKEYDKLKEGKEEQKIIDTDENENMDQYYALRNAIQDLKNITNCE